MINTILSLDYILTVNYDHFFPGNIMYLAIEDALNSKHPLKNIVEKVLHNIRLSISDGIHLYESNDLALLGSLAQFVREQKAGSEYAKYVYYINNMHLNPTNYCVETCRFCSYANIKTKSYTWSIEQVLTKVKAASEFGITEIHMVGGLNPDCDLNYFTDIMKVIKNEYPNIHLKAFTAVEIEYFAKLHKLSYETVLTRLIEAGLGSMPGGGAEIFNETVRQKMKVKKTPASTWLEIHGIAHNLGLKSNATMLTGIGENIEHKIEHLNYLRNQQDKSGGFLCFIPLKCYYEGTDIKDEVTEPTGYDLLKDIAISRLFLDNFPHIKAYWVQLGEKIAQIALNFGADDIDGTIFEERITHAAGTKTPLNLACKEMEELISTAGFIPCQRDTLYNQVKIGQASLLLNC